MKEIILYAYHIEVENLKEYKEYSVFEYQKSYFYFTKLKRNEKEFQELLPKEQTYTEIITEETSIITLPWYYKVGANALIVYGNGEKMIKDN